MITWKYRFGTAVVLSLAFLGVYGATGWWSAQREDLGVVYFGWESWIPFLPWTIIPYFSIDLLFVVAPFVVASRKELRRFAGRVLFVVLVAGVCYLFFPLTLAIERPVPEGLLGPVWKFFIGMDRPHNLIPSLHIALCTVLAAVFLKRVHGWRLGLMAAWFALIVTSTLTTHQHHVADVYTGFLLGLLALHLVRERPRFRHPEKNLAAGVAYGVPAIVGIALLPAGWPGSVWVLWPVLSFGLASISALGVVAASPAKRKGKLTVASRLLWAPVLLGQWLSWCYYRRNGPAWNQVVPGVFLGRILTRREARLLMETGIGAVLDVTAEFSETPALRRKNYCQMDWRDLTAPTVNELHQAAAFIDLNRSRKVYVHCKAGFSRSAAAVGAYLLLYDGVKSLKDLEALLHRARPGVVIRPEIRRAWKQLTQMQTV